MIAQIIDSFVSGETTFYVADIFDNTGYELVWKGIVLYFNHATCSFKSPVPVHPLEVITIPANVMHPAINHYRAVKDYENT